MTSRFLSWVHDADEILRKVGQGGVKFRDGLESLVLVLLSVPGGTSQGIILTSNFAIGCPNTKGGHQGMSALQSLVLSQRISYSTHEERTV